MAGRPAAHTLIVSEGRLPRLQGFARTKEGGEPRPLGGGSLSVFFLGRKGRRRFSFFWKGRGIAASFLFSGRKESGALPRLFHFLGRGGCVSACPMPARALRTRRDAGEISRRLAEAAFLSDIRPHAQGDAASLGDGAAGLYFFFSDDVHYRKPGVDAFFGA